MYRPLFILLAATPLAACTWVALEDPAKDVLVLPADRLTGECKSQGKVKVSVLDKVGVLERHESEVVDDLDVLARNHAAKQGADTVVRAGKVVDGTRQYEIFRCTKGSAVRTGQAGSDAKDKEEKPSVEVLPYDGGSDN